MASCVKSRKATGLLLLLAFILVAGGSRPAWTFANMTVGSKLQRVEMPTLDGTKLPFLGQKKANVFLFFRPDTEFCRHSLKDVAKLEHELADKPVYWVVIVADTYKPEEVKACVKDAGLLGPVLVDKDNALYGELGVRMLPSVGIADENDVLLTYLHYTKLNFAELIRVNILHQLGEMSDEQLAEATNPSKTKLLTPESKGKANLKLAKILFSRGDFSKALEAAGKSLELDPKLAAAHALVGKANAAMGDCAKAIPAFAEALKLDPNEPDALEGKKGCEH